MPPISIPFAFSCGSNLDLTNNVKWKNNAWNTAISQSSFSVLLQSHGPKSCFTYLGVISAGAPSPGHNPAWYRPCNCSRQGPRKGKNTGREQAWHAPPWPPMRSCINTVQEAWLSPASCCGIRTHLQAAFPTAPMPQPEQPNQFSTFCISGPISIFNYSYKTAVI